MPVRRDNFGLRVGGGRERMLRMAGDQVESLFDELLPVEVRKLPAITADRRSR